METIEATQNVDTDQLDDAIVAFVRDSKYRERTFAELETAFKTQASGPIDDIALDGKNVIYWTMADNLIDAVLRLIAEPGPTLKIVPCQPQQYQDHRHPAARLPIAKAHRRTRPYVKKHWLRAVLALVGN